MRIDISNKKTKELKEIAKKHPNGHIKSIKGVVFWVFKK